MGFLVNGTADGFSNFNLGILESPFEFTNPRPSIRKYNFENDDSLKLKTSVSIDQNEKIYNNNIYLDGFENAITGTQFTLTKTNGDGTIDTQLSNTNFPLPNGAPMVMPGAVFTAEGTSGEITTAGLPPQYVTFDEYRTTTGEDKFNLVTFVCVGNYNGEFTIKIGTNNGNTS